MNPFASRCIRPDNSVYRFAREGSLDQALRREFMNRLLFMLHTRRRAAIVGAHGTGKSTLLQSLEPHLKSAFNHVIPIRLTSEKRDGCRELLRLFEIVGSDQQGVCLVIDGFEQLRWFDRWRLVHRLKGRESTALLVTCHRTSWLVPPCLETHWDEGLSRYLTQEKLGDVPTEARVELLSIFESRLQQPPAGRRNLRDLWFEMYDAFEVLKRREGNGL